MTNYLSELKKTLIVAGPIIASQISHILLGVADSIMVGSLGGAPLAASAFVNNVMSVPFVMAMGLSTSISVTVSHAFGAGKHRECGQWLSTGALVLIIPMSIIALGMAFGKSYLSIFSQPQEVYELSQNYFAYISLSLIPMCIFVCLRQFSEGLSQTLVPMVFQMLVVLINVLGNWILIFGNWGAPRMELDGAGLSTLLARIIGLLLFWMYLRKSKIYQPFLTPISEIIEPVKKFKHHLKIGLPSATQYLFEVGAFSFSGIMIGWISTQALAAHQIALNIASATFMVAMGTSFAASIRVGQYYGAKDPEGIKNVGYSALGLVSILSVFFGLGFIALRNVLPGFYISDTEIIGLSSLLLVVAAAFQLFDATQAVGIGILRGVSDVRVPTLITFAAYWIWTIPFGYVLAFKADMGALGVWISLASGLFLSSACLAIRFEVLNRRRFGIGSKIQN
jgi:MATE family multidrug resistance protein